MVDTNLVTEIARAIAENQKSSVSWSAAIKEILPALTVALIALLAWFQKSQDDKQKKRDEAIAVNTEVTQETNKLTKEIKSDVNGIQLSELKNLIRTMVESETALIEHRKFTEPKTP